MRITPAKRPPIDPKKRSRGRPKGSLSRVGTTRLLAKQSLEAFKPIPSEQVAGLKAEILNVLDMGIAETLSDAARRLAIRPSQAHNWLATDDNFRKLYNQAREVLADRLERELLSSDNVIAKIFLLKGLRPQYRDNFHVDITDNRTRELLDELRRLGNPALPQPPPTVSVLPAGTPTPSDVIDGSVVLPEEQTSCQ